MGFDDGADAVREAAAGHGAGRARVQIGQERNRLFAIPGAFNGIAPQADQLAQLAGCARHFDLEIGQLRYLLRHARQKRRRQHGAAGWGVLHHDGNIDGVGHPGVELVDLRLWHAEGGAMVGRHDHHHGGAQLLRLFAAFGADARAVMRGGDDDGHAARHMFQCRARQQFALLVGQRELLGEIGQQAQAVHAGGYHEVQAAFLASEVQRAVLVEGGGNDREDAPVARCAGRWNGHGGTGKYYAFKSKQVLSVRMPGHF